MDTSNSAKAPSETYAIAPTGDTILVVGEEKTELRVHSICMKTTSKVFDALFGPHFSEGQPSNGDLPKEIHLPHDDARAMTTICKVIHHRNDLLPDVLEPGDLPEIAVTADKYDCILVLKYVMSQWLDFKDPVVFLDLGSQMIAAYMANNHHAFRQITRKLITGTSDSYHLLLNIKHSDNIPLSIYYSLEKARNRIQVSVQDELLAELVRCCDRTPRIARAHMQMLQINGLWGASPFTVSIDSAIEKARKMAPPPHSQYDYGAQQTKETRNSRLEELRESAGLCLICVWSGDIEATFPCKLDHYKEA